ncbi:hypothetical protein V8C86DRAFT_3023803 [Haematococcus lacustris]
MYPPSPSPSSLPLVHQTRPSHYKGKTKVRANEDEAWRSMEDQGASGLTPILLPPASFTLPYPMPPIPLLPTPPPRITPRNLPHHKGKTKVRANREPTWCGMEQNGVNGEWFGLASQCPLSPSLTTTTHCVRCRADGKS